MRRRFSVQQSILMASALLALGGCGFEEPQTKGSTRRVGELAPPVYLADIFTPTSVVDRIEEGLPQSAPIDWQFAGLDTDPGADQDADIDWVASPQIADLRVVDGALTGRSTGETPLLRFERTQAIAPWDSVFAVEIDLRVSAGGRLAVGFAATATSFERIADEVGSPFAFETVAVDAGDAFQTVRIPLTLAVPQARDARFLFLRPTDVAEAEFAIRAVRIILRSEYLASLPSGVARVALGGIHRDALLLRPGEEILFEVQVPENGRLELSLGTLDAGPTTFRIDLSGGNLRTHRAVHHTVTTPDRWERVVADLSAYEGLRVDFRMSHHSDNPSAVGLFGGPVVRSVGLFEGGRPRTVIFVLADSLRADHLDLYGHGRSTAPWLRRMASEGAIFLDTVAQGSGAKASTPSILTSLYASAHGVRRFRDRLPHSAVTLAERFRDSGYATIGYSSAFYTGKFSNLQQGFDSFHERASIPERSSKTSREYVDRLLDWLGEHRDVPTFALLHVLDPHDPYEPRPPHAAKWIEMDSRERHLREIERVRPEIRSRLFRERGLASSSELRSAGIERHHHVRQHTDWYDASIGGMDAELARITERLAELKLLNDAIVVVTSDHGEEFHDHGGVFHGSSLYAEMIGIPLVMWGPSFVQSGTRITATVQSIDIMPTLLQLAGIAAPPGTQGRSLVELLRPTPGETPPPRDAFAEKSLQEDSPLDLPRSDVESAAILSGGWKLVHNTGGDEELSNVELFDRDADPTDLVNVAESYPEEVDRLMARLVSWREEVSAGALAADEEPVEALTAGELEPLPEPDADQERRGRQAAPW